MLQEKRVELMEDILFDNVSEYDLLMDIIKAMSTDQKESIYEYICRNHNLHIEDEVEKENKMESLPYGTLILNRGVYKAVEEIVDKLGGWLERDIFANIGWLAKCDTWNDEHKFVKVMCDDFCNYFIADIVTKEIVG